MFYILLTLSIILIIIGIVDYKKDSYGTLVNNTIFLWGRTLFVIFAFITLIIWGCYSYDKNTIDKQLLVLEEQNELVLKQIEPIIQKALEYESNTYKELGLSADKLIAVGNIYPDLKNNVFIQTQMQVIINNQKDIRDLKLMKARLGGYRFWIWNK